MNKQYRVVLHDGRYKIEERHVDNGKHYQWYSHRTESWTGYSYGAKFFFKLRAIRYIKKLVKEELKREERQRELDKDPVHVWGPHPP